MTGPSSTGVSALMGTWASASVAPSRFVVHGFQVDGHRADLDDRQGSFSATCGNNLAVAGTAEASLTGSTITWSAAGNATSAGLPTPARLR